MADSFTLPFRFIHPPGFSRTSSQMTPGHPREGCFSTTVPKFPFFFFSPPTFLVAFIPHTSTHFSERSKETSIARVGNRLMFYENEMESSSMCRPIYTAPCRAGRGRACPTLHIYDKNSIGWRRRLSFVECLMPGTRRPTRAEGMNKWRAQSCYSLAGKLVYRAEHESKKKYLFTHPCRLYAPVY